MYSFISIHNCSSFLFTKTAFSSFKVILIVLFTLNITVSSYSASTFSKVSLSKSGFVFLECFDNGAEVDVNALIEAGIVKNPRDGVKILGNGELTKKLNVKVDAFSASAKEKIEALGGTAEVI